MMLLRSFPPLAFALVLLSIAGVCAAKQSVPLLLVAGTMAAMSWYVTEGPRGRSLPRWVSNLLVIAASLNVFVDLFQNRDDVMGVLSRFAVWLTLIKLYERRTARDHAHLLTLSLLLMLTGCMQSSDLLFGFILLLYAVLGIYVLLLYQLYRSYEHAKGQRQAAIPADYRLAPALKPIMGSNADLRFRTQASALGALGIALSMAAFLAFPRGVGADMLGTLRPSSGQRAAAFMWEVDLNVGGRITDSRLKALTLQVRDANDRPVELEAPLLLRGAVLDDYQGQGRWRAHVRNQSTVRAAPGVMAPLGRSEVDSTGAITQRIVRYRAANGIVPIFSLSTPIAVSTESHAELLYDRTRQTIKTAEHARRLTGYAVQSRTDLDEHEREALIEPVRPVKRDWFGQDAPIVRELALSILRRSGVPTERPVEGDTWQWNRQAAAAFTRHLQSGGGFTYTTDLRGLVYHGRNDDPIVHFLTQSKRGHCEFFASGLAALCHSVNIPARLVVGYVAFDYDHDTQQYNILESNAHAWVEAATGERRWTAFDPTPPATLASIHSVQATFADTVRDLYQSFEGEWSSAVVGYDDEAQSRLVQSFNSSWSRRFSNALDSVRAWMERVNQSFYLGPAGYIWMGIVASALVIAVIALVKLMRRSLAVRRTLQLRHVRGAEYQRMVRQLGFYLDMLRVLKRGGVAKPEWQPPLAFARAGLGRQRPQAQALVRRITETFYKARYGHRRLDRAQLDAARKMVEQLAAVLKAGH